METAKSVTKNGQRAPQAAESSVIPAQSETIFNARTVVDTLRGLMTRVTEHEVTPETVAAACRCSSEISSLLRLHLDAEKLRREDDKIRRAEQRLQGRS